LNHDTSLHHDLAERVLLLTGQMLNANGSWTFARAVVGHVVHKAGDEIENIAGRCSRRGSNDPADRD
jgi:hypothetical protein